MAERVIDLPRGAGRLALVDDGDSERPAVSLDDNAAMRDLMDGLLPG
ncbi:hypothetical protein [Jiangella rhizosphaerae]|nr:hypothetical protein [Jiangella rhizosphaerae]